MRPSPCHLGAAVSIAVVISRVFNRIDPSVLILPVTDDSNGRRYLSLPRPPGEVSGAGPRTGYPSDAVASTASARAEFASLVRPSARRASAKLFSEVARRGRNASGRAAASSR